MIVTLQVTLIYKRIKAIMVFHSKTSKGRKQLNIQHAFKNELGYIWHFHSNSNIEIINKHGIPSFSMYTYEDVSVWACKECDHLSSSMASIHKVRPNPIHVAKGHGCTMNQGQKLDTWYMHYHKSMQSKNLYKNQELVQKKVVKRKYTQICKN